MGHFTASRAQEVRGLQAMRRLPTTEPDNSPGQIPYTESTRFCASSPWMYCVFYARSDTRVSDYQVPVAPRDRPKTTVITLFGLFEFNVMTFGLCNTIQTFQRLMDTTLHGLDFPFVYIDDILVASKDKSQHKQHLRAVFERLREYGSSINVSKCNFGSSQLQYLGYERRYPPARHSSGSYIAISITQGHLRAAQIPGHCKFLSLIHKRCCTNLRHTS